MNLENRLDSVDREPLLQESESSKKKRDGILNEQKRFNKQIRVSIKVSGKR